MIVNSDVDGLDSNGTVTFSGGTTVINGHSGGMPGEGAIDANGPVYFNGGTVFGAGRARWRSSRRRRRAVKDGPLLN